MQPTAAVIYCRVSTASQGASGLGMDAQEARCSIFCVTEGLTVLDTYREVESGTHDDRPMLAEALTLARSRRAALVVAKVDRLGRRLGTVVRILDGRAPVYVAELGRAASRLVVEIQAVVAADEARRISERTKAALEQAKARGVQLGNPRWSESISGARAARMTKADRFAASVMPAVEQIRSAGVTTLAGIAGCLTARGIRTSRGGQEWNAKQVSRVLARV
jgi:DNA invertase Pin-like site-specific DNA recombinase